MLLHPVIAESGFASLTAGAGVPSAALGCPDLLQRFAGVSDHRSDRGRIHPVGVVLTLCAAAVVAGMSSFTALAGWVADVPADVLTRLYGRESVAPTKSTIWRVLTGADADTVDAVIGAWLSSRAATGRDNNDDDDRDSGGGHSLAGRMAIAVDGKTLRGAVDDGGTLVHLMAAATHTDSLVLGQVNVGPKTNEIPLFAPLLQGLAAAGVDLGTVVVTADALHTQRAHATYLHAQGAGFVFTAKGNQPHLFHALDTLDWASTPIAATSVDRKHGRVTTRTIQVMNAPTHLPFPHVAQVWLIERYTTTPDGVPTSSVAALGVTNLTPDHTTPAQLAALVQGHWGIESLHWLRDTVYREDHSRARTRSGPRVMAALRNLAIGAIRLTGHRDITETTRAAARNIHRPLTILGLTR